jgi:hypothetical protein
MAVNLHAVRGPGQQPQAVVAVGTRVTPCPPHRSRRAELPHRALTLSYGVQRSVLRARDVGLSVVEANG